MKNFNIGFMEFVWNEHQNTVRLHINGEGYNGGIELNNCDTETLVRQYCKNWALDIMYQMSEAIGGFDTLERPHRDRHL